MDFEIITSLSTAIAGATAAKLVFDLAARWKRISELTQSSKNARAVDALRSGDIDQIGHYIYDDLGSIRLKDFTLNREIESQLNAAVDKIEDFFGEAEELPERTPNNDGPYDINLAGLPDEYNLFLDELRRGELWNSLAKLRLYTERKLGALAESYEIPVSQRRSARQLLRALSASQKLDPIVPPNLDYALTVCNRAIHGEDVTDDIALEAIQSAIVAFERLNKPI